MAWALQFDGVNDTAKTATDVTIAASTVMDLNFTPVSSFGMPATHADISWLGHRLSCSMVFSKIAQVSHAISGK